MIEVFAPASIANFFVGFDILGFAFDGLGDRLRLQKKSTPGLDLKLFGENGAIPTQIEKNTATMALKSVTDKLGIKDGFSIEITKGIPLASGLGGSAASAVAAVFAINKLLALNLSDDEMIEYALDGEFIASGSRHADNLAPCLKGGLQFVSSVRPVKTLSLQLPKVYLSIIHPHLHIETAKARGVLSSEISLKKYILQSQKLGSFLLACERNDIHLLKSSLDDLLIEPQRQHLITGFSAMKECALKQGAWAFTISGAGPTSFAVSSSQQTAENVSSEMQKLLKDQFSLDSDVWVTSSQSHGARVL